MIHRCYYLSDALLIERDRFLFAPPERRHIPLSEIQGVHFQPRVKAVTDDPEQPACVEIDGVAMFGDSNRIQLGTGGFEPLLQWLAQVIKDRSRQPTDRTRGTQVEVPRELTQLLDRQP